MSLLLDTHTLLWFLIDDAKLSATAEQEINAAAEVFVSIASLWEIGIKTKTGKLSLPAPLGNFLQSELDKNNFQVRPIGIAHIQQVAQLPLHHRDPFDRMLVAQSIVDGLALVSCDPALDAYGIMRIW